MWRLVMITLKVISMITRSAYWFNLKLVRYYLLLKISAIVISMKTQKYADSRLMFLVTSNYS
jgi:hypothetical protein